MNQKLLYSIVLLIIHNTILTYSFSDNFKKTERMISFSIGYSHLRTLDLQISPLLYQGHSVPMHIGFLSRWDQSVFLTNLGVSFGLLRSNNFDLRIVKLPQVSNDGLYLNKKAFLSSMHLLHDECTITYLRKIQSQTNSHFHWYYGSEIKQYYSLALDLKDIHLIFIHGEVSLNPSFLLCYTVNSKSTISSHLSFPVLSIISRKPYSNDIIDYQYLLPIGGTKISSLNAYQRINLSIGVEKHYHSMWSITAVMYWYWLHYRENSGVHTYTNSFHLKLSRKL